MTRHVFANRLYLSENDPIKAIGDMIVFGARDYGEAPDDAWLYGIVIGWDDDDSTMDNVAQRHGWTPDDVSRLRRLHVKWHELETGRVTSDDS